MHSVLVRAFELGERQRRGHRAGVRAREHARGVAREPAPQLADVARFGAPRRRALVVEQRQRAQGPPLQRVQHGAVADTRQEL